MDSQGQEAIGDQEHYAADPEVLRRLSQNDPNIRSVYVHFHDYRIANNQDWAKEVGRAISKNTHLRSICIEVVEVLTLDDDDYDDDDDDEDEHVFDPTLPLGVPSFFMELAENRSIEDLFLDGFNHSHIDVFKILAPFFEHNHNLQSISMYSCWQLRERIPSLISALKQAHGLNYIGISKARLGDLMSADLINALRSKPGLHHLKGLNLGGNKIGQQGCVALRKLLSHPACKIHCLEIHNNHLDNDCMDILYGRLVTNNSIKFIDIHRQKFVTASGWGTFFDLFSNSICSVKTIRAYRNDFGDDGVITLGDSFVTNRSIQKLDLRGSRSITPLGWQGFSEGLKSPNCPLLDLNISECEINDKGAFAIASALGENISLENLNMSRNRNISSSGWINCFLVMRQHEIRLVDLNLSDNNIDDLGATMLVTILVKMSALESFRLCKMTSVSADGWREFADVLKPRSSSKLRVLYLGKPYNAPSQMDDSVIICFADALVGNTSLSELSLCNQWISDVGRRALFHTLCDKSSLVNTFLSNHTLQSIYYHRFYDAVTGDLKSLLAMNKCENKFEVARKKILANHFGDVGACVRRIFAPMPALILPTALSWIGRDRREYSMMYHFLHCMPWPLDATAISSTE
jgi:hypothetical protein